LARGRGGCPAHKSTTSPLTEGWIEHKNLHENHAKQLFVPYGLPATVGFSCTNPVTLKQQTQPTNSHHCIYRLGAYK
ncbi:hypothetical protein ACVGX7_00230, partial [Enterobacter hormaechei]